MGLEREGRSGASVLAILLCIGGGCGDEVVAPSEGATSPPAATGPARPEGSAAAVMEEEARTSSWPSRVQSLADAIARFEDRESCEREVRLGASSELGEMLDDLGYDEWVDDLCASLAALKQRSRAGCEALSTRPARRGCLSRLALLTGDASLCPGADTVLGREVSCVAWARRDPTLCRGADEGARPRCVAVARNDRGECARARERARCEAEVSRYGALASEGRRAPSVAEVPATFHLEVELKRLDGTTQRLTIEEPSVERGVWLTAARCRYLARVASGTERANVALGADAPTGRASLSLPLTPRSDRSEEIELASLAAELEVKAPGFPDLSTTTGLRGEVTLEAHVAEYGAPLRGTLRARQRLPMGEVSLQGRFVTWIRDRDALGTGCEQAPP